MSFALKTTFVAACAAACVFSLVTCGSAACGPSNCDTCCDAKGVCVGGGANATAKSCGGRGSACVDCAKGGSFCNSKTLTCGGDGPEGTCTGCVTAAGLCVAGTVSTSSPLNCGLPKTTCAICDPGQSCSGGTCTGQSLISKVGDPCRDNSDCDVARQITCRRSTAASTASYPSGFCTRECGAIACPNGSTCATDIGRFGEGPICLPTCSTLGQTCRGDANYRCNAFGAVNACWLSTAPRLPAATKTGAPCSTDGDCGPYAEFGDTCLLREDRFFEGGLCSRKNCVDDAACGPNALCLKRQRRPDICVSKCPVAGQTDGCRAGMLCTSYPVAVPDAGLSDGGAGTVFVDSLDGYCFPERAPAPSRTGQSCLVDRDCRVPASAVADCLTEKTSDGGTSAYVNGYCSALNCVEDSECAPNGAGLCAPVSRVSTACFQRCKAVNQGQGECAKDYVCSAEFFVDGGVQTSGRCTPNCKNPSFICPNGTSCASSGYCR
jgi:hypothetical protein